MKNLIERVDEKLKSQSYINLEMAKNEISSSASGFYWIYTKLPLCTFSAASTPSNPGWPLENPPPNGCF